MKKILIFLLFFVLIAGINGCKPSSGNNTNTPSGTPKSISDSEIIANSSDLPGPAPRPCTYEIRARLHKNMPEYRFAAAGITYGTEEWDMGFVLKLDVYDEKGLSLISKDFSYTQDGQIIGYPLYNNMMDTMGLHVTDVNFDGYRDVIILNCFAGAHSNTWYDCWLWDVKTSSFIYCESFSEICNPALDFQKKCIYSAGGSGAGHWGGSIYKYINGKFTVTNLISGEIDGFTETKLVNGKMEIVRQSSYDKDRDKLTLEKLDELIRSEREYYVKSELWKLDDPRWYWHGGHHADKWLGG